MKVKLTFEEILDGYSRTNFCMVCCVMKKFGDLQSSYGEPKCCPNSAFIPLENFEHEFQMEIAKRLYDAQ